MINQFDIGIWDETDNFAEPIEQYLKKYKSGEYKGWKSTLASSQLIIVLNGKPYELYTGCFVEIIGQQFLHVYHRLLNNQPAFLKYNLIFSPEDFYLLFEPQENQIFVSEFRTKKNKLIVKKDSVLKRTDLLKSSVSVSSNLNAEKGEFKNRFPFLHWHPNKSIEERARLDQDFIDYIIMNKESIVRNNKAKRSLNNIAFPKTFLLDSLYKNGNLAIQANKLTNVTLTFDYY